MGEQLGGAVYPTAHPDLALQAALVSALRADAGVCAALGVGAGQPPRVHERPPAEPLFPMLTVTRAQTRPFGGAPEGGVEHVLTLTAASRFRGLEECQAAVAAVRAALDGPAPVLAGHRVVSLRVTYADVFRGADWRNSYGVVRVRAVTERVIAQS